MKSLLVCALLALVPFSSLRMVCLDAHGFGPSARAAVAQRPATDAGGKADATSAAGDEDEDECARVCARRPDRPSPPATPAVTCLLVADPTCAFLTTATVAVMPHEPALTMSQTIVPLAPVARASYLAPVLARPNPPPRS